MFRAWSVNQSIVVKSFFKITSSHEHMDRICMMGLLRTSCVIISVSMCQKCQLHDKINVPVHVNFLCISSPTCVYAQPTIAKSIDGRDFSSTYFLTWGENVSLIRLRMFVVPFHGFHELLFPTDRLRASKLPPNIKRRLWRAILCWQRLINRQ